MYLGEIPSPQNLDYIVLMFLVKKPFRFTDIILSAITL